jgi:hypothetical protein
VVRHDRGKPAEVEMNNVSRLWLVNWGNGASFERLQSSRLARVVKHRTAAVLGRDEESAWLETALEVVNIV